AVAVPDLAEEASGSEVHAGPGGRVVIPRAGSGDPGNPGRVIVRRHRATGRPCWYRLRQQRPAVAGQIVTLGTADELVERLAGRFLGAAFSLRDEPGRDDLSRIWRHSHCGLFASCAVWARGGREFRLV